jgi:hypothetical protein
MGDHTWPAIYPGIIVGLLYGLSLGGLWNPPLGALGGLAGGALTVMILPLLGLEQGLAPVAVMVILSVLGAFCFTRAASWLVRPRAK